MPFREERFKRLWQPPVVGCGAPTHGCESRLRRQARAALCRNSIVGHRLSTRRAKVRDLLPLSPQGVHAMSASSTITLTAADGFKSSAYVSEPSGAPKGAIVVLQEIFGVNSHIRGVADGYAPAGYLAIAPSTFDRVERDVELGYTPDDMAQGSRLKAAVEALPAPGVLQDIQAAVEYAARAGEVGIVGYCWGGLLVWRAAEQVRGLSAAV